MALQLKTKTTINELGTELYIEFTEATGLYDEENNPGGFGAPNPARNTLAIFLHAVHKNVAGDVGADVHPNTPGNVEAFTINMTKGVNGVLHFIVMAIPLFDSDGVYEDGDVVYNTTDPLTPAILKMVESEWVEKTLAELVSDDNITHVEDYAFPIPAAIALSQSLNAKKLSLLRKLVSGKCANEDYSVIRNQYEYVDSTIKAATASFCRQAFNQAQLKIEEIFAFEESLVK